MGDRDIIKARDGGIGLRRRARTGDRDRREVWDGG